MHGSLLTSDPIVGLRRRYAPPQSPHSRLKSSIPAGFRCRARPFLGTPCVLASGREQGISALPAPVDAVDAYGMACWVHWGRTVLSPARAYLLAMVFCIFWRWIFSADFAWLIDAALPQSL